MSKQEKNPSAEAGDPGEVHENTSLGDFVRRMAYLGIGTAFATQETASRLVKELKLPREAVSVLTQGIEQSREEMTRIVSRTFTEYLQNLDAAHLLKSAMDGMNVKVSGEVQFNYDPKGKGDKLNADIKASAKPGRKRRGRRSSSS